MEERKGQARNTSVQFLTPDYEFFARFEDRARGFLDWLIALDELGNQERQTITLTKIIDRAAALRKDDR